MPKRPVTAKKASGPEPLSAADVYRSCDPAGFTFATTAELEPLTEIIGQKRAVGAVDFGVGIKSQGYNIYALGVPGTGKSRTIMEFLRREAATLPTPPPMELRPQLRRAAQAQRHPHAPRPRLRVSRRHGEDG